MHVIAIQKTFRLSIITRMAFSENSFKFALVRWTEGKDKDQLSVLETDCVRGFDKMCFHSNGKPEKQEKNCFVEWRTGKVKKSSGWPVYAAELVQASSKIRAY